MTSSHSETGIGPGGLVSEAWRIALSLKVASALTVLIVAAVCGFILSTTGQTVRAEQDVLGRIDLAGTRLVTAIDDQGSGMISPEAVERISRLSSVEWVIGLGPATDVRNSAVGPGGNPAALRYWWGNLPGEVEVSGRPPQPGEAIVGTAAQAALGLDLPVGSVDLADVQLPVVGGFAASDALASLNTGLLAVPGPEQEGQPLRSVHVLATSPSQVQPLTAAVASILGADDPTSIRFETSQTLAEVRAAVAGELGRFSRRLVLGALGIGLVLVAVVVHGSVTLRRQDFGRRRALGASRTTITTLIAVQDIIVGILGALLGILVGGIVVWRLTGGPPDATFTIAVATLTVLTVGVASIPPALIAAYRDPVRVLRVP